MPKKLTLNVVQIDPKWKADESTRNIVSLQLKHSQSHTWSFTFLPNKFNSRTKSPNLLKHVDPSTLCAFFFFLLIEWKTTLELAMSAQNDIYKNNDKERETERNPTYINGTWMKIKARWSLHGISNCIWCFCFEFQIA